jgi:hypothetical protein
MKNLVTVLAIAALMTSCQKEDVQQQTSQERFIVESMFQGVTEDTVQSEACSPVNATEVPSSLQSFTIDSNGYVTTQNLNGNTNNTLNVTCAKYRVEFVDSYEVTNIAEDGEGTYYTEALRLYEGDVLTDNYILLLDFCDEHPLTLYFTASQEMVYLTK